MYINSINYFRGISIILIVFGHSLDVSNFTFDSIFGNTILNLMKGGTSFFVFISGFLFHHIFYQKFKYNEFLIKKTKFVFLPYLILSTIPILYLLLRIFIDSVYPSSSFTQHFLELLYFPIFRHYLTGFGESFIGYWYIPFVMIIFVVSPLFVKFIKLKLKTQIKVTFFLLFISIFMHRGDYNLNNFAVFQNVIFFTPIYLFGIIASERKDIIYSLFNGKEFYFLFSAIALALIQAYMGKFGNYEKFPFVFDGIDLMIIQKILLSLFLMIFLNRFENYKFKQIEIIANNSFGIFFIHGIIIVLFYKIKGVLDFSLSSNSFIIYFVVASLVFIISLFTTLIVKRLLPKYSRYLVGS